MRLIKKYIIVSIILLSTVLSQAQLFEINDCSGCLQQASTKLLLSSDNLTCKPLVQDITDARDILNRWLELNDSVH